MAILRFNPLLHIRRQRPAPALTPSVRAFRPHHPSDPDYQRWPGVIACVQSVHQKGFGFALPLTGESDRGIFLNESRIASLRSEGQTLEGAVIAVRTNEKDNGRIAALDARRVNMADAEVALQLWQQVAHNHGRNLQSAAAAMALLPDRPVLLPLILALLDAWGTQAPTRELLRIVPAQAWTCGVGVGQRLPLEHAAADIKLAVVRHWLEHSPDQLATHLASFQAEDFYGLGGLEASEIESI